MGQLALHILHAFVLPEAGHELCVEAALALTQHYFQQGVITGAEGHQYQQNEWQQPHAGILTEQMGDAHPVVCNFRIHS